MIIDFHVHSNNSFDSKESIINMCKAGILNGVTHLAFTEHLSFGSFKKSAGYLDYNKYSSEIASAKDMFKGKLSISKGLELCEPHLSVDTYRNVLEPMHLDYVLGSVHNIGPIGLMDVALKHSAYDSYNIFFNEVFEMACYGEFNVAAHLDLMTRYAFSIHGDYEFNTFQEQICKILKKLIQRGIGIEINTSGLRKEFKNLHPKIEVLKLYKELGGEIITIGSDAHIACQVGNGCKDSLALISDLGFKYVFTFENQVANPHRLK